MRTDFRIQKGDTVKLVNCNVYCKSFDEDFIDLIGDTFEVIDIEQGRASIIDKNNNPRSIPTWRLSRVMEEDFYIKMKSFFNGLGNNE